MLGDWTSTVCLGSLRRLSAPTTTPHHPVIGAARAPDDRTWLGRRWMQLLCLANRVEVRE
jgi:hypothetical protein